MAKTPSDKLHRLIRSLTAAEKRYFRIFIRGKTERASKYWQLFEAMSAMEIFDETALITKIYKSQVIEGKKYSELKAYLYDLVLKSLQTFDEQQLIEYKLNQLLQSVAALFKRGHYEDCRELLHKASKLARHYERFTHQLEIINWQKQLAYTRMDVDFLHKNLEQLQYEEDTTLERLHNATEYRKAFFQVYTTIKREAQYRGADRMARLQGLVQQEAFQDPDLALSHKARVMYYRTLNLYHYAASDYPQFYESGRQMIALMESQPHFLRESIADYIAALSNFILSCGLLRKYDEVRAGLEKLNALTPITADDRRKIHQQYFSNKFALCIFTGEFEEARLEMVHYQTKVAQSDPQEHETASFLRQFCCVCFGCADYDGALDYLNEWLSQPRTVGREDLQSVFRIVAVIIHFEMGNLVLLESLLRSATRFMQKKNRLYDLERRFMQCMYQIMRQPGVPEHRSIFQRMKADLDLLSELPGANALLQTFDLEAWLDSKINHSTFAAAVKAKWLREMQTN